MGKEISLTTFVELSGEMFWSKSVLQNSVTVLKFIFDWPNEQKSEKFQLSKYFAILKLDWMQFLQLKMIFLGDR